MTTAVSKGILETMTKSSWIRKMFEEGARMKMERGAENVQDFSIGNPVLEPPDKFLNNLKEIANHPTPGLHKYMPNPGFPETRQAIADFVSKSQEVAVPLGNIVATCGAAGGLNTVFHTIIDDDDEIIVLAPYFVEYGFYVKNHGGKTVAINTRPDFQPDVEALRKALTKNTRAVIINNPNNPSGVVYDLDVLKEFCAVLKEASEKNGREIYLISDEPYRRISYDGVKVQPLMPLYKDTMIVSSFSKDLGLAGERIGFIAVSPNMAAADVAPLMGGLIFSIRTLGFVNAPALAQRAIVGALDDTVDINWYKERRDMLFEVLKDAGLECVFPQGAFYLFPKVPEGVDDVEFTGLLKDEGILVTPGRGFGQPGYVRFSYVVPKETIDAAAPKIKDVVAKILKKE